MLVQGYNVVSHLSRATYILILVLHWNQTNNHGIASTMLLPTVPHGTPIKMAFKMVEVRVKVRVTVGVNVRV